MTKLTYQPTTLERWVSRFYKQNGLVEPNDLYITDICNVLDIYLSFDYPYNYSYQDNNIKIINLDYHMVEYQMREAFFHELCHLFRHSGNQIMMPDAFRELQERDAKHFTIYASIPFHMLTQYKLKNDHIHLILAEDFNVPVHIAKERIDRIYRNATKKHIMYA